MTKLTWPAAERNKQPILEVLQRVLPPSGTLLEIASGTGQHAVHFARHLRDWVVQPSDVDPDNLASIRAWRVEAALPNLREPLHIDVCRDDWQVPQVSAIYNANLIHIAPWQAALGLARGAARHLLPGGVLIVYGPFRMGGAHTAPSNAAFDASLRERDARFGVRNLEDLLAAAEPHGLTLTQRVEMPANNQTVVLTRSGP
jgi:SAM-dependent methyltransferase